MHIPAICFHLEVGGMFMCEDLHADKIFWGAFDDPLACSWDVADDAAFYCIDHLIDEAARQVDWLRSMLSDTSVEVLDRISTGGKIRFEEAEPTLLEISTIIQNIDPDRTILARRITDARVRVSIDGVLMDDILAAGRVGCMMTANDTAGPI